jgi:hypothetical protein
MRCEYTVSFADFSESLKGYRKVSAPARIGYWLYLWLLPALAFAIAAICCVLYFKQGAEGAAGLFWPIALGLGIAFGLPARYRMGLRRSFRQRDALTQGRPMAIEFNDEAIRFIVPGGTEIRYPWNGFTHYFINEKVLVLMVKDAAFHTVPRCASTEACVPSICERLHNARKV